MDEATRKARLKMLENMGPMQVEPTAEEKRQERLRMIEAMGPTRMDDTDEDQKAKKKHDAEVLELYMQRQRLRQGK